MTPTLRSQSERISLQDIAMAGEALNLIRISNLWTYDFHITSDSVTQGEKIHS